VQLSRKLNDIFSTIRYAEFNRNKWGIYTKLLKGITTTSLVGQCLTRITKTTVRICKI